MTDRADQLAELLTRHHTELLRFVRRQGSGLLGHETAEDLVQGTQQRALREAATFTYRGEREFLAWLHIVARRHIADRADHYGARKRAVAGLVRLTRSPSSSDPGAAVMPASASRGPATVAERRELLQLALRVLEVLPARDAQLVRWNVEGVDLDEQARRLQISYGAAQRAALRALERYRRTFQLAQRGRDGGS